MYWSVTVGDIRTKLRLYVAAKQYGFIQDFETLAKILSLAFGNKEESQDIPVAKTKEEFVSMVASVFGKK